MRNTGRGTQGGEHREGNTGREHRVRNTGGGPVASNAEGARTILGDRAEHPLQNVVVDYDVQHAQGIEVAPEGQGKDRGK